MKSLVDRETCRPDSYKFGCPEFGVQVGGINTDRDKTVVEGWKKKKRKKTSGIRTSSTNPAVDPILHQ